MNLPKILPLTVLLMSAACQQNGQEKKDITNQVVALKTEFAQACESKLGEDDLYDGSLNQIVERRNELLRNKDYSAANESWWCGNKGGFYRATFPQTEFPNPAQSQHKIKYHRQH